MSILTGNKEKRFLTPLLLYCPRLNLCLADSGKEIAIHLAPIQAPRIRHRDHLHPDFRLASSSIQNGGDVARRTACQYSYFGIHPSHYAFRIPNRRNIIHQCRSLPSIRFRLLRPPFLRAQSR